MLHHYRNQSEKFRFIEKLEQLLLQGFGISAKVEEERVQAHQSSVGIEKEVRQSIFFKSKAEKEHIEAERVKAEERYEMALGMVLDASKLNRRIITDMEINPKQYVNLLKRKIFNPHKCNIADRMRYEREKGIRVDYYKVNRKAWRSSSFALLYAIVSNWIRDEDMTIMECDAIYQKFNCSCQVANSSRAQKILFQLYEQIQNEDAIVLQKLGDDVPKTSFPPDKSYAKLFVEYWDCEYTILSSKDNDIWSNLSLEETIEQARKGIGPVKRTEIPWETRYREKYHTFWRK